MEQAPRYRAGRTGDATRRALVRAGLELFSEKGFAGTSLDDIAREARVNKALIGYHFGGKAGLYAEILDSVLGPLESRLRTLLASDLTPEQLFRAYFHLFQEFAAERPQFPVMLLREVLSGGPNLDDRFVPHIRGIFDGVRQIIDRGVAAGVFRRTDPLLTYLTIQGSFIFFFATESFRRRVLLQVDHSMPLPTTEAFVRNAESLFLEALRVRPSDAPARDAGESS